MNERDPLHPVRPDEAAEVAGFVNCTWDGEIVSALTQQVAHPARSPTLDAGLEGNSYIAKMATSRTGSKASRWPGSTSK